MRGPVRGGRFSRLTGRSGVLVLLVLMTACGGDAAERAAQSSPAPTVAPAEPSLCTTDTVVSAEMADSGEAASVLDMQARLLTSQPDNPEGFRSQTVIVDAGLGSFRISLPRSYSVLWRYGTSGRELLADAEERDPVWRGFWEPLVGRDDIDTRAISIDLDESDEVVAVLITLTPASEESGDALAAGFAGYYAGSGGTVGESCGVTANGSDGAYVEHTVPRRIVGGGQDRTQLQFLIPDPPNNALWGVTCDVPRPMASQVKDRCRQIASTFQPLPFIR